MCVNSIHATVLKCMTLCLEYVIVHICMYNIIFLYILNIQTYSTYLHTFVYAYVGTYIRTCKWLLDEALIFVLFVTCLQNWQAQCSYAFSL